MKGFCENSVPDQSGKTILVTGANTGIGYETTRVLASRRARVLLGCRSESKAELAMTSIRSTVPHADLVWLPLNLASLESIRHAARSIDTLDILINNAGVMTSERAQTVDGFELQLGVNHLGHFALTTALLPLLDTASDARIVNVSSEAHRSARLDFDDLQARRGFAALERYGTSKLANLLFTAELRRRLALASSRTLAVACHPGVSDTDLSRNQPPWFRRFVTPLVSLLSHSAAGAALSTLMAATDASATEHAYFGPTGLFQMSGPPGPTPLPKAMLDEAVAKELWDVSVALTGSTPVLEPTPGF